MPNRPRQCTHIKVTGLRCGSPALRREFFCYFHTRVIKGVQLRVDMQLHSMALLEDAEAIQLSLMHVVDGLIKGTLEPVRARLIIQALRIAARNIKEVRFDQCYYRESEQPMVREVPNYAGQYLQEHPELDSATVPAPSEVEGAVQRNEAPQPPAPHPAAERCQNAAHAASRGTASAIDPAPEERKKDDADQKFPPTSEHEAERKRLAQVEAAIAGAERGNWKDLKTVLEFAGIAPANGKGPAAEGQTGRSN
jgi:hypothetical protein